MTVPNGMAAQARAASLAARNVRKRWTDRDNRYIRYKRRLTPDEIPGVRQWRWHEAAEVGDAELMREAERWTPPLILG